MLIESIAEYGLAAGILLVLAFVIKWILTQQTSIIKQAKEERDCWKHTMDTLRESIVKDSQIHVESQKNVKEAHKFERKEHKQMLSSLKEVCEFLKSLNGKKRKQKSTG